MEKFVARFIGGLILLFIVFMYVPFPGVPTRRETAVLLCRKILSSCLNAATICYALFPPCRFARITPHPLPR